MLRRVRRRSPPTNPRNGGLFLFHATAAATTKPDCCAGAGSGERHAETKDALLKRPHTRLSTARPPGGVHRQTTTPRQRGGRHHATRHGAGVIRRPPEGRHVSSGHIRARLAPVLNRSSFVVVISGQWCTHCDARDNRRLVAINRAGLERSDFAVRRVPLIFAWK